MAVTEKSDKNLRKSNILEHVRKLKDLLQETDNKLASLET